MNDTLVKLPRLGPRQWEVLGKIVRTNGGGIYAGGPDERTIMSLHKRGLVQGKSGQEWRAVHTREGLEIWRARLAQQEQPA